MNKHLIKVAVIASLLSAAFSHAAPVSPLHNKVWVLKQVTFPDAHMEQAASISMSTTIGARDQTARTETVELGFGAIPTASKDLAGIPALGLTQAYFDDLFTKLQEMQQYQTSLQNSWQDQMNAQYSSYASTYDSSAFTYTPPAYGSPDLGSCFIYDCANSADFATQTDAYFASLGSAYDLALKVRKNVSDPAAGTDAVVKYATAEYMKSPPAPIDPTNPGPPTKATLFKKGVIDFLNKSNIALAYVDTETAVTINNEPRRVVSTLQIAKNDTPTSVGQYVETQILYPPGAVAGTNKKNVVHIKYTNASQYADLFNPNQADPIFMDAAYGKLTWSTDYNGSPVVNQGIGDIDTHGAYDNLFPMDYDTYGTPVKTINNFQQKTETHGVDCLVNPTASGCKLGYESVPSIMRKNSAVRGDLTYVGRWELQLDTKTVTENGVSGQVDVPFPPIASVAETERVVEYNLCSNMHFFNTVQVNYTVRRLIKKYTIFYSDTGVIPTIMPGYPQWETQNHVLANPAVYSSHGTIPFPRSPYTNSDPLLSIMTEDRILYNAIVNPVTFSSNNKTFAPYVDYTPTMPNGSPVLLPDGTPASVTSWQSRMSAKTPVSIIKDPSLPSSISDPTSRDTYFSCAAGNEDQIASLLTGAYSYDVREPGAPGQACVLDWKVITGQNADGSYIYEDHSQTLANNTCQETCPADGSAPVNICARPR